MGCKIIGCGKALPERRVTNDELASLVDTSDEWIVSRTGIRERRIAVGETATDLGVTAARRALGAEEGGWRSDAAEAVDPASIDLLVCMTISGDTVVPSQAAMLKAALGLPNAVAFDLNAACAGCVYGMDLASQMLELSAAEQRAAAAEGRPPRRNPLSRALVVGTERLTRLVDWTDRATCVLFGDGAGAVVLEWREGEPGVLSSFLKNTDDLDGVLTVGNAFDMTTFPFGGPAEATGAHSVAVAALGDRAAAALGEAPALAEGGQAGAIPCIDRDGPGGFEFAYNARALDACAGQARASSSTPPRSSGWASTASRSPWRRWATPARRACSWPWPTPTWPAASSRATPSCWWASAGV